MADKKNAPPRLTQMVANRAGDGLRGSVHSFHPLDGSHPCLGRPLHLRRPVYPASGDFDGLVVRSGREIQAGLGCAVPHTCGIAIARKIWRNNITAYQKKKRNCHHRRLSLLILLHESRATSKERWEISHPRKGEASLPDLAGTFPVDTTTSIEVDSKIDDPQTCTHYATDIYAYLRSLEEVHSMWSRRLRIFKPVVSVSRKLPQFTLVVSCNLARWQSVGFGISEAIPKILGESACEEPTLRLTWRHRGRTSIGKLSDTDRSRRWQRNQEARKQGKAAPDRRSSSAAGYIQGAPTMDQSLKKDVPRSPDSHAASQAGDLPSTAAGRVQGASGIRLPRKTWPCRRTSVLRPRHGVPSRPSLQSTSKERRGFSLPRRRWRSRTTPSRRRRELPSSAADCIQGASGSHCGHKKDGTGPPDIPGTSLAEPAPSISADCNQGASGDQSSKKDNARPSDLPDASQAATAPLDLCGLNPRSVGRSVFQENRFQMCIPDVSDIYGYLKSREVKLRPLANYLEAVKIGITATMRKCLVDWMAQVVECFRLRSDILCLAVSRFTQAGRDDGKVSVCLFVLLLGCNPFPNSYITQM
ncbi:Cyclin, C-terminal domain [Musa troglodytarum]|uniref:Cyclin, C-terminal domain n=1 Tax=Musa troglodytarum TaxID=320322 RepID=A0A9E7ICY7_9LILI|nr:Cyclin, C-terminal domain [Musa troglodytarum]